MVRFFKRYEEGAIFKYVDCNGNGHVTFEEFFEFYSLEPPPASPSRSERAASARALY